MAHWVWEIIPRTPAGPVVAVSADRDLLSVKIGLASPGEARRLVQKHFPQAEPVKDQSEAGRQLREYFAGVRREFDLRPVLDGLPLFYKAALGVCAEIPFGNVRTYADIAAAAGSPRAARAVGQAAKHNPTPIVIPCHRIVAARGIGGFSAAGGVRIKHALLAFEAGRSPGGDGAR